MQLKGTDNKEHWRNILQERQKGKEEKEGKEEGSCIIHVILRGACLIYELKKKKKSPAQPGSRLCLSAVECNSSSLNTSGRWSFTHNSHQHPTHYYVISETYRHNKAATKMTHFGLVVWYCCYITPPASQPRHEVNITVAGNVSLTYHLSQGSVYMSWQLDSTGCLHQTGSDGL